MQLIELETRIAAPPERCFLLSLSIDLHMDSTSRTRERAVAGVTHGIIGPDQTAEGPASRWRMYLAGESGG